MRAPSNAVLALLVVRPLQGDIAAPLRVHLVPNLLHTYYAPQTNVSRPVLLAHLDGIWPMQHLRLIYPRGRVRLRDYSRAAASASSVSNNYS